MKEIQLIKGFLSKEVTRDIFDYLLSNIKWHETLSSLTTGEPVKINRKMAYVYDKEILYTYANLYFKGEVWNEKLSFLKDLLNKYEDFNFNSVLLNLYKDGKDEIKWHSDKEECLGDNPVIGCINLGAKRKFWFRKKDYGSEKFFIEVEDGDLLIMGENCQRDYLHAILKEKEILESRISLTFRKVNHDTGSQYKEGSII